MDPKELVIRISGDRDIIALRYQASEPAGGVVLITPAMAVKQYFYGRLAAYLAQEGYIVYTMDYSGIGLSKPGGKESDILDWIQEVDVIISHIMAKHPDLELIYLSHSLGGQIFGSLDHINDIERVIIINSQNGYWRYYSRFLFPIFWYVLVPLTSHLFGYFPSGIFGMGEPVPKKAMLRWKRWCTHPDYLFSDPAMNPKHDQFGGKLMVWSFTDDNYAPLDAVEYIVDKYSNAEISRHHIDPQDVGLEEIGHFGFFRKQSRSLWPRITAWLGD